VSDSPPRQRPARKQRTLRSGRARSAGTRLEWIRTRAAHEAWFFADAANAASIALHRAFGFREATRRFWFPGATFPSGEAILFRARI
jgi:hypothetical protein